MRAEMREEERLRLPRQNPLGTGVPGVEIDVGRRRRRKDVRPRSSTDAGSIADECNPAGGVEVADVVRGVPGGIPNLQFAAGNRQPFATFQNPDMLDRNRSLTPVEYEVLPRALRIVVGQEPSLGA